jgi:MFS family permease
LDYGMNRVDKIERVPELRPRDYGIESRFAWMRLASAVALGTIGNVAMWSVPVVLPAVQAEFGVARAQASLPFTMVMVGFAVGGVLMGRLADRFGIIVPLATGAAALASGYMGAAFAPDLTIFALFHLLIGLGASATFGPLMADASRWFTRRRGFAVSLASCGNYIAGMIWPPILVHFIANEGWREAHIGIGIVCAFGIPPLLLVLKRPPPPTSGYVASASPFGAGTAFSPNALQVLLSVAGLSCCAAMAMPQVHIVAYCGDLGYGVARGAEMLSLMLGLGLISRVGSGFLADRIGGAPTLLLGSTLQGLALFLYLLFDGLTSLYVISALFGLFQGGLVPMYAVLVREYFPPQEAGTRLGLVLMATLFGMALGGWMSGAIFDLTGSYRAAFMNGLLWNALNIAIVLWLLLRPAHRMARA